MGWEHLGEVSVGRVDGIGLSRMGGIYPEEPEGPVGAGKSMRWVGGVVIACCVGKKVKCVLFLLFLFPAIIDSQEF